MNVVYWLALLCWTLCVAGLAWYILGYATQITYVTLADGRRQERSLPLLFRLLLPLAPNLDPLLRKLRQQIAEAHPFSGVQPCRRFI